MSRSSRRSSSAAMPSTSDLISCTCSSRLRISCCEALDASPNDARASKMEHPSTSEAVRRLPIWRPPWSVVFLFRAVRVTRTLPQTSSRDGPTVLMNSGREMRDPPHKTGGSVDEWKRLCLATARPISQRSPRRFSPLERLRRTRFRSQLGDTGFGGRRAIRRRGDGHSNRIGALARREIGTARRWRLS